MKIDLKEIALRESEQIEWKLNVADIDSVICTIVAFSNDFSNLGGGYVVCGAEETKDEYGFQKLNLMGLTSTRCKELENKILSDCRAKVSPEIVPIIVEERIPEDASKRILVFIIPASPHAHAFRASGDNPSTHYIRIGRETREARNGLLRELLVKKNALEPWDRRMNKHATVDDIDPLGLRDGLQSIGLWDTGKSLEDYLSDSSWLSAFVPALTAKEPLVNKIHPRNFTLLLFGRHPTKHFPGAYSKFSVYPGKDRSEPTAERIDIAGSIVAQAKKLIELLNAESSIAFDKASDLPNVGKYPLRALQEAVINALVHRDYELDQPTSVTVFSDRIEIYSPGGLLRAIDPEQFKTGKSPAIWRNQAFAYFFNKLQLAQAEGQGIPTILRTMKESGSPAPIFTLGEENVTCILPAHPRHERMRELSRIENQIVLGNRAEAMTAIESLLEKDPLNFRALELYCEVNSLLQSSDRLFAFIQSHSIEPQQINPGTAVLVAETLLLSKDNDGIKKVASKWLEHASLTSLEMTEVRRVAISFRKLKRDEEAIRIIDQFLSKSHPSAANAVLFDIRAKAKIDLAKRCTDTARGKDTPPRLRAVAWDGARKYLHEAERDLTTALEFVGNEIDREYIRKDLEFLNMMKSTVQKPKIHSGRPAHWRKPRGDSPKRR